MRRAALSVLQSNIMIEGIRYLPANERYWRLTLGLLICLFLSLDLIYFMYFLIGLLFAEAITNIRLTMVISRLMHGENYLQMMEKDVRALPVKRKINFEAERMVRLCLGLLLLLTYYVFPSLWFFPWFIGITLTSAGLAGVCPLLLTFQWMGFKGKHR